MLMVYPPFVINNLIFVYDNDFNLSWKTTVLIYMLRKSKIYYNCTCFKSRCMH